MRKKLDRRWRIRPRNCNRNDENSRLNIGLEEEKYPTIELNELISVQNVDRHRSFVGKNIPHSSELKLVILDKRSETKENSSLVWKFDLNSMELFWNFSMSGMWSDDVSTWDVWKSVWRSRIDRVKSMWRDFSSVVFQYRRSDVLPQRSMLCLDVWERPRIVHWLTS